MRPARETTRPRERGDGKQARRSRGRGGRSVGGRHFPRNAAAMTSVGGTDRPTSRSSAMRPSSNAPCAAPADMERASSKAYSPARCDWESLRGCAPLRPLPLLQPQSSARGHPGARRTAELVRVGATLDRLRQPYHFHYRAIVEIEPVALKQDAIHVGNHANDV